MRKLCLVALLVLIPAFLFASDNVSYLRSDMNGEFKLTKTAYIGSLILDPGTYAAHSVLKNGKHMVHIEAQGATFEAYPEAFWLPYSQHLDPVGSTIESVPGKAGETGIYFRDEGDHIVVIRLVLKGEDHVHVF